MRASGPELLDLFFHKADLGPEFSAWADRTMRRFDFAAVEPLLPTDTFSGSHTLHVGDRRVELLELGPAHTEGDTIAHVPEADAVFTGDILFIEGTPVMWAGPVSNWLTACDRILSLGARTIIPGHGPVTDASGVRDVARYLTYVRDEARARFDAGMDAVAAADDIDLTDFADWGDKERIAVNVTSLYREFDPSLPEVPVPELFTRMAGWAARH
jgi:cyclase